MDIIILVITIYNLSDFSNKNKIKDKSNDKFYDKSNDKSGGALDL
jgi:hypothetical protein